jgi:hypothetical protein
VRRRPVLLLALLGTATLAVWVSGRAGREDGGGPDAATTTVIPAVVAFTPVDVAMTARARSASPPGGGLLVVTDGRVVFEKVYEPFGLDRSVPLGPIGDWMTAVVAAALVDDGLLTFDASPPGADRTLAELLADPTGSGAETVRGTAERLTGRSWEETFRTRLAEPLRLTGTVVGPTTAGDGGDATSGRSGRTTLRDLGAFADVVLSEGVARGTRRVASAGAMAAAGAMRTRGATEGGVALWIDPTRDAFAVVVVDDRAAMPGPAASSDEVVALLPDAIDAVRSG